MKHKHKFRRKLKTYGAKRTREWCHQCDAQLVVPEPSKRRERQKAKKLIREEIKQTP